MTTTLIEPAPGEPLTEVAQATIDDRSRRAHAQRTFTGE
jgi:hypothetical protein